MSEWMEKAKKFCIRSPHHTSSGCGTGCEVDELELVANALKAEYERGCKETTEKISNVDNWGFKSYDPKDMGGNLGGTR